MDGIDGTDGQDGSPDTPAQVLAQSSSVLTAMGPISTPTLSMDSVRQHREDQLWPICLSNAPFQNGQQTIVTGARRSSWCPVGWFEARCSNASGFVAATMYYRNTSATTQDVFADKVPVFTGSSQTPRSIATRLPEERTSTG